MALGAWDRLCWCCPASPLQRPMCPRDALLFFAVSVGCVSEILRRSCVIWPGSDRESGTIGIRSELFVLMVGLVLGAGPLGGS